MTLNLKWPEPFYCDFCGESKVIRTDRLKIKIVDHPECKKLKFEKEKSTLHLYVLNNVLESDG